ncbi:MAG: hypothetical protein AAGE98_17720, partial [Actinomycetota bacterium]
MSRRGVSKAERAFGTTRRDSYSRLAVADGLAAFTVLCVVAAVLGVADHGGDAIALVGVGLVTGTIGFAGRRTFVRRQRPPAARVISGLASTWAALVLAGAVVYLVSGTIDTVDEALFESAAGFSTVAATTVDPETLSTPMSIFRAGTQFVGGLVGLLAGVVALPRTMKGNVQIPKGRGRRADRLVPDPVLGRRRVVRLYLALATACGIGYFTTGLGARSSLIHALTTVSTGGFSDQADSFAS